MILTNEYVAGLFDGEGWFEINRVNGSKYRMKRAYAFSVRACLQMRDKIIIDSLQETYGGTVSVYKPRKENHSTTYKWIVIGKKCKEFSEKVKSHLLAKSKQAEVAINFQIEKDLNGNKPLEETRYNKYCDLYDTMKELNKKGVGK